jgi:hypothetical protein
LKIDDLPYAVVQRLRLIDVLLDQQNCVNRSVLVEYFGISIPQASVDISKYNKIAPGNMKYDLTDKCYRRGSSFQRVWK